jgi:hypothetical protein
MLDIIRTIKAKVGEPNMSNPRGYFPKLLAMDSETSGLSFNGYDPSYDVNKQQAYQAVSWGLVVVDSQTLKQVDDLYVEIQFNDKNLWNDKAEKVHGLSREHLAINGMPELEAVETIGSFVYDHFGSENLVPCCGHNVSTFDIWFMRRLMDPYGIMFKTGNRFVDTNSIGYACYNTYNSDDLFDLMDIKRELHNSLEDAKACVKVLYNTRTIYNSLIG